MSESARHEITASATSTCSHDVWNIMELVGTGVRASAMFLIQYTIVASVISSTTILVEESAHPRLRTNNFGEGVLGDRCLHAVDYIAGICRCFAIYFRMVLLEF
jgi:hypothetical protein